MNPSIVRLFPCAAGALVAGLVVVAPAGATPAWAQSRVVARDVCVNVDEARDTLSPQERVAARLLVSKQFELEGWRVVAAGCSLPYTVAHIRLGNTIAVTLSGPNDRRDGTALGLDDLPALYSQMVRSIVTGRPMEGMNVIDRTNVTVAQALPPPRVSSDSFGYARIGAGRGGPAFGFGHRGETNALAIDVSFLNVRTSWSNGTSTYNGSGSESSAWSLIKLEGLHFRNPRANASPYVGGGISWGAAYASSGTSWANRTTWSGSGLQGELTAGYETGRASTLRVFVEADATLPFYLMKMSRTGDTRYSPSLVVSVGVGWQRVRR